VPVQEYLGEMEVKDVYLYDELGETEAVWLLSLKDFGPFLVDIDTKGNNYYDMLDPIIEGKKRYVYSKLGIPNDFEFTKLYKE
jgi:tartrate dehydratase beta subunit/fumarate hydratase class I family protein